MNTTLIPLLTEEKKIAAYAETQNLAAVKPLVLTVRKKCRFVKVNGRENMSVTPVTEEDLKLFYKPIKSKNMMLNIGDEITSYQYGSYNEIQKISRVTAKRAYVQVNERCELAFERIITDYGFVRQIGRSSYSPSYCVVTDEIRTKIGTKDLILKCQYTWSKLRLDKLEYAQLEQLKDYLNTLKPLTP